MFHRHFCLLLTMCLATTAFGQTQRKTVEREQEEAKAIADAPVQSKPLAEVKLENVPFSEVINKLRELDPSFQVVVAYAPGAERGGPLIQELHVRNVTAQGVLQLLNASYPQLEIQIVHMNSTDMKGVWSVVVNPDPRSERRRETGERRLTRTHRLRELIDEMKADDTSKDARTRAREAIVSLVEAAVEASMAGETPGATPSIRVHEATEMLVFSGSTQQSELVAFTLATLATPRDRKEAEAEKTRVKNLELEVQGLRDELRRTKESNETLQRAVEEARRGSFSLPKPSKPLPAPPAAPAPQQPQAKPEQ